MASHESEPPVVVATSSSMEEVSAIANADNGGNPAPPVVAETHATAPAAAPTLTPTAAVSLSNESRKVVVHNVEKYLRPKHLKKLLDSWLADARSSPDATLQSIKVDKTKSPNGKEWMHVWVEEDGMVEPFLRLVNDTERKTKYGKVMYAKRHNETNNTGGGGKGTKRGRGGSNDDDKDGGNTKRNRTEQDDRGDGNKDDEGEPKTEDDVRDKLTPYWRMPYSDQLVRKKMELIKKSAQKIIKGVKQRFRTLEKEARQHRRDRPPEVYEWCRSKRGVNIQDVRPTPQTIGYRNKSEFTFGYRSVPSASDKEGEAPTRVPSVGFLPFGWKSDVALPHGLQNMPTEMCGIADMFNDFLRDSPLPPYQSGIHRGVWRTVTIRSSARTGQVMIIVVHAAPEGAAGARECGSDSYGRDVFEKEKERLLSMLTKDCIPMPDRNLPELSKAADEEDKANDDTAATAVKTEDEEKSATVPFKVTSIFFQEYNGLSHPTPNDPVQHVYGKKFILENLGKNTFQVSPGAFFQVTTVGAEVLYDEVADRVREVSENPADTLLLDVCCGTGTIGLHCMKEGVAGRVLGVDISEPAIEDAKANAVRNGYGDEGITRFVASRAELVLAEELQKPDVRGKPIVAVVDPAREGLHADVVRALRCNPQIRRLVYVSCNPTGSLTNDAASLCQLPTKKYKGLPFKPMLAQPVDMFPLTSHCELVVTFDRMTEEEYAALTAPAPSTGSEKKKSDAADSKAADQEETFVKEESKSEAKSEPESEGAAVNEAATLTEEVPVKKEGEDNDVKMESVEETKTEDV